ncbi:MAG: 50S ribosomal protein L11 methyltransferase [Chloroflexi bacterium]|nr:MAG: 50S ribosomal protein L11 methyltransferase [Chloroflexota bacterium]
MTANSPKQWLEIAVEVAGIDAEVAADVLRQACPGGVAMELGHRLDSVLDAYVVDGDAPALVKAYLPASEEALRVRRSLQLALKAAPLQQAPRWRRSRRLKEESWRDSWKKGFGVQRAGRSLIVKPSWVRYEVRDADVVIEIDPGMAFGTGQHATTAMCLRAIEERVRSAMRVLDLGSGSGILSIAAAKLGARRVLALDIDPQAVKATRENVAANGVEGLVEVREGTLEGAGDHRFDVIAANISGLTQERLAPLLAASLTPAGTLIASGFLEDAVGGLTKAFERTGLRVEETREDGVWRAIIAVKHGG